MSGLSEPHRNDPGSGGEPKPADSSLPPAAAHPPPGLSPGRKWLFRLLALLIPPLLVLGCLEAALRLSGYGYYTGDFEKIRVGSRQVLVNNEGFSLRFFPTQLARWPVPLMMEARKPTDTCRIFILGESAAMGDPEPAYGAGRYLETLLRERFPAEHFEVIDVAMTAINSHTVPPIA